MSGFDVVRRGNYFGGEPVRKTEVEVKRKKQNKGKEVGKDRLQES